MRRLLFIVLLVLCPTIYAYPWNSWQPPQPIKSNYLKLSSGPDTQAPTAPGNVAAVGATVTSITVTWDASTDNIGVDHYAVYRDNVFVQNTGSLTFTDTGRDPETSYAYKVYAVDAATNTSSASSTVNSKPVQPVFDVLAAGSITPTIGTAGSYTRSGTAYFNNSATTVSTKGANSPCAPAFVSGLSIPVGGFQQLQLAKNWILYSEDFTHAEWTAIGGGAASANTATAPDGNVTADTISGAAGGDGLQQDSGISLANTDAYELSVWLKSTSGTPSVDLVLKDAGSQTTTNTVAISTTWKRYIVYRKFTASPTGNLFVQILVGNTSTVRAWGAMLETSQAAPYTAAMEQHWAGLIEFGGYVPTTSAVASQAQDELNYTGTEVKASLTKESLVVWVFRPTFTDEWMDNLWIVSKASNTLGSGIGVTFNGSSYTFAASYGGNSALVTSGMTAGTAGQFNQIVVSSDYDNDVYAAYINSVQKNTNSTARAPLASYDWFNIGHEFGGDNAVHTARTVIGRIQLFNTALTQAEVTALYNKQVPNYTP